MLINFILIFLFLSGICPKFLDIDSSIMNLPKSCEICKTWLETLKINVFLGLRRQAAQRIAWERLGEEVLNGGQ